jgi:arabinogalactan oligomer/maltooligosaccharide transport system substrate-binding protein
MKAFAGVGTLAVNAKSKHQLAAATLAQYSVEP